MVVGALRLRLFIGQSNSLKARRSVVRSLKDRIRSRFNVSVAEVGEQDLWQSAAIGIAAVAADGRVVDEVLAGVARLVESDPRVEVIEREQRLA
ncbi:MAG: DUF503 domain-containing protein [Candidatus Eisenbacteria bacterium]|nr:DUF503 domain-containing protein [Candidatus Eisenbacteria bacterium]